MGYDEFTSFGMARRPKQRHGITTNKGHGVSKKKRKMAAQSRRKNRKNK